MRLLPIHAHQFPLWKQMRESLYPSLTDSFHETEMHRIYSSQEWQAYFIEDDESNLCGFIELSMRNIVDGCPSSPVAYIEGIYLKPDFRAQGYGRQIVKQILQWCRDNELTELAVDTELDNTDAQNFYTAMGFQETYRIVQFRKDV